MAGALETGDHVPRFPEVHVQLTNTDGNAMVIIGQVANALRNAGHRDQVDDYVAEAMSGDYDNVLWTTMRWVEVS